MPKQNKPNTKATELPEEEVLEDEYDELGVYDEDEVNAALQDTINQAEGNFLERNGGGASAEPKKEKQGKQVEVIGKEEIRKATQILKDYKDERQNFDARVIDNEEWWKLRHWKRIRTNPEHFVEPTSAWLFNSIMNKLADYSDNYPEPNIRARTEKDKAEAERIKNMLPMILEANDYEQTYLDTSLSKVKSGTSFTGVFWNADKDDIDIKQIDLLQIYWQGGITDIQKSRNVFTVELVDNDLLEEMYPDKDFKTGDEITTAKYLYEDDISTVNKTAVIDWYYKKKGVLHYCKYANDTVLVSTENDTDAYPNGLYDHGLYPFVPDTLFKMEGAIQGFGFLDVCRSPQECVDKIDQAIITNILLSAQPRYFKDKSAAVNEKEFLDWNKTLVECGNISEDHIRQIQVNPLGAEIYNEREAKIQELKQTSGNSDVNTGTSSNGITAASAISQLIETGSKSSRLTLKGTYRAYRQIIYFIIELMRQFYVEPRYVRTVNSDGTENFDIYDNSGLVEQEEENAFGEIVHRLPQFDIEVSAQKSSPYNKMNQNELALQFYQYQFFNPQNADATLAALEMMDFDHKEEIIRMVSQNGTLYDQLMQMMQQMQAVMAENEQLKALTDLAYDDSNLTGMKDGMPMPSQSAAPTGETPTQEQTERALGKTTNSLNAGLGNNSRAEQLRRRAADATEVG